MEINEHVCGIKDGHECLSPSILMTVVTRLQKNPIQIRFQIPKTLECRLWVAQKQRDAFIRGTSKFYEDFVDLFNPLRSVCQKHRDKYEPQLKVIRETEKSLAQLEKILAPVEKALSAKRKG